jgi:hypothetical protein
MADTSLPFHFSFATNDDWEMGGVGQHVFLFINDPMQDVEEIDSYNCLLWCEPFTVGNLFLKFSADSFEFKNKPLRCMKTWFCVVCK